MSPALASRPHAESSVLTELAAIFAAAILRLHARAALEADDELEILPTGLEVPAETRLSGPVG